MAKKMTKKEMEKLKRQMGISNVNHNRPPIGRPVVFWGKTNKQIRKEGKRMACDEY